jgi:hypothetical protein
MKIWHFACVTCFAVAAPTVGTAQTLVPAADITPYGLPAAPPLVGAPFVGVLPPGEIIACVRSAGFDPVSRPMHRGAVYVVFAIDRYDADVRLTVDARSGRVLSATRLAAERYDDPGYGGYALAPRAIPPGYPPPYQRPPQFYERDLPMPPADVPTYAPGYSRGYLPGYRPGYGLGRVYGSPPVEPGDVRLLPRERSRLEAIPQRAPAASAGRPPLPRTRPGEVVARAAREPVPPTPIAPPAASQVAPQTAPPPPPAEIPADVPVPQQPGMVPIAPLE